MNEVLEAFGLQEGDVVSLRAKPHVKMRVIGGCRDTISRDGMPETQAYIQCWHVPRLGAPPRRFKVPPEELKLSKTKKTANGTFMGH